MVRYVESEGQIQANTYQCYAVPQDIVHLTTGEDPNKLIDFLKMVSGCSLFWWIHLCLLKYLLLNYCKLENQYKSMNALNEKFTIVQLSS